MACEHESGIALNDDRNSSAVIEDTALFFGPGLYGEVYRPSGPQLPGWVICDPFGKERTNSNRLGFEWARSLAGAGHWVLRFDYRGTGDSAGSFENFTLDDYVKDIGCARAELERLSGMACRGLVGLRLGASLAAKYVADSSGDLDLVLWEPIIDGNIYRNSLLRTAMANEMVHSAGPSASRHELQNKIMAGQSVVVDGFALKRPMYDSLADIDLIALGRPSCGQILIVQIKTRRSQPIPPLLSKLASMYSATAETRLEAVDEPPVWMRTRWYRWQLEELFDRTLGWMAERKDEPQQAQSPVKIDSGSRQDSQSVEYPVCFGVGGAKVKGILHQPLADSGDFPNVVLIAAGEACRTAFFYRQLAVEIANRGWNVLRFDPRGIGDSHGDLDCRVLTEVFSKVEDGVLVSDTEAAIEFMQNECGPRGTVLIGLCGGAITSILMAQTDKRVIGIAPLELPMRLTPRAGERQQGALLRQIPWDESLSGHRGTFLLLKARSLYHLLKTLRRRAGLILGSAVFWKSSSAPGESGWYREKIGDDASCAVLAALGKTLDRRIPVFCVFADTEQPKSFESVLPGLLANRKDVDSFIKYRVIQGADHNFTMPGFSEKLTEYLMTWLEDPNLRVG